MRALPMLLAVLPLASCTVGESGGGGDDAPAVDAGPDDGVDAAAADFAVSLTPPSLETQLGRSSQFTVTLDSIGYAGPVTLQPTGLPAGWTASFEPETIALAADQAASVALTIAVPTLADAGDVAIGVLATAAPGERSAAAQLSVANAYTLTLTAGTGAGAHPLPARLDLKLGATLHVENADPTGHRVHSDGGLGFPHQDATMPLGATYTVTPGEVGNYRFYCHDHGEGTGVTTLVMQ